MNEKTSFNIYTNPTERFFYNRTWINFMNDHPPDALFHRAEERLTDWKGVRVGDWIEFETEQDMMFFILRWS